jgi:hypothetical protein
MHNVCATPQNAAARDISPGPPPPGMDSGLESCVPQLLEPVVRGLGEVATHGFLTALPEHASGRDGGYGKQTDTEDANGSSRVDG